MIRLHNVCLGLALLAGGAAQAQEMDVTVELLGPLGTQTNRKGDQISARVISPDALKGDIAQGKVTESRGGNKIRGEAALNFTFETLQHGGEAVPIASQVKSILNSKGQADVDEEGRVIRKSSNVGAAIGGTALGGLLGGLKGGAKGAAIGAAAGAAVSIVLIQVVAQGPSVRFDAGSKVVLSVKTRSGPALASLTPNAAPAAASAPAPEPAPAAAPAAAAAAPDAAAQAAPAAAAGSAAQPDFTALKDDFIPGEKALLYDDFTDMAPDEAPPHWKVRGAAVTLMAAGKMRQIVVTGDTRMTPMVTGFPANFTVEMEVRYENGGEWSWNFYPKGTDTNQVLNVWVPARGDNELRHRVRINGQGEVLMDQEFPADLNQPTKHAIWMQDGRMRVYLNGRKVMDVNQVKLPPLETALLEVKAGGNNRKLNLRMVRIAESTPDFSRTIAASGRYVSHGILFDTDSDRLKAESAAAIKSIAGGLMKNPNLKLRIEGHTDSVGNADHNLDLSKRRAEAVKTVLVSQFSVEAERLTTDGLGATKPIDSNDTPQGRAQNRRVEFVKQ